MWYIELNAGLVGLGLTYTISLADMLQYTIRLSAEVENMVCNLIVTDRIHFDYVVAHFELEPIVHCKHKRNHNLTRTPSTQ